MCSSCGGNKAARIPGGSPRNAILIGESSVEAAQPVTFLRDSHGAKTDDYKYVIGDGVQRAIDDGDIQLGYKQAGRQARPVVRRKAHGNANDPEFYVKTGRNKWIGFKNLAAAERYAASVKGTVQTRAEVIGVKGEG